MDFKQIECFLEVCRCMNFTKAAKKLYISQQGVSKIISKMEEELEVPLFYRNNSALQLSEYGQLFLLNAQRLEAEYNHAVNEIHALKISHTGNLNVCIPTGMMHVFPQELVDHFLQCYPSINVSIMQYDDLECEDKVLTGKMDIGFCAAPLDTDLFLVHHSHKEQTFYMLSDQHPLAQCSTLTIEQLRDQKFITISEGNKCGWLFHKRCETAGFTPNVYMRTADTQLIVELCRKNAGIGFYVGTPEDKIEGVKIIPDAKENWDWEVCLVTAKRRFLTDNMKAFINVFKNW